MRLHSPASQIELPRGVGVARVTATGHALDDHDQVDDVLQRSVIRCAAAFTWVASAVSARVTTFTAASLEERVPRSESERAPGRNRRDELGQCPDERVEAVG